MGHTRRNSGADGDNRNLFSGLEAQGTPYIPRPLIFTTAKLIRLSTTNDREATRVDENWRRKE